MVFRGFLGYKTSGNLNDKLLMHDELGPLRSKISGNVARVGFNAFNAK